MKFQICADISDENFNRQIFEIKDEITEELERYYLQFQSTSSSKVADMKARAEKMITEMQNMTNSLETEVKELKFPLYKQ